MTDITIKEVIKLDVNLVARVIELSIMDIDPTIYPVSDLRKWAAIGRDADGLLEKFGHQYFIKAMVEGHIAGIASATQGGYLDLLYVHPDYQGKGVATALYNALEDHIREHCCDRMWAHVSKAALPFFKKNGYMEESEQEVNIGEAVLINYKMSKNLVG